MWFAISLIVIILLLLVVVGLLAKALTIQVKKNEIYTQWIVELQDKVEDVYQTISQLDEKQMFSKDDEVGSVFQQMVELISSLNEKTTKE